MYQISAGFFVYIVGNVCVIEHFADVNNCFGVKIVISLYLILNKMLLQIF